MNRRQAKKVAGRVQLPDGSSLTANIWRPRTEEAAMRVIARYLRRYSKGRIVPWWYALNRLSSRAYRAHRLKGTDTPRSGYGSYGWERVLLWGRLVPKPVLT